MRRRVGKVALTAVVVSLVLLAVPFAVGIRIAFFSEESTELERAALAAAVQVGPDVTAGDPVELPAALTDLRIAVYDGSSVLRAGAGPAGMDRITRSALTGKVVQGRDGGELVVAVPVVSAEQIIGVVRAASPVTAVWTRVLLAWLAVAGLAVVALLVGLAVAIRQSRRLSEPLESLAAVAGSVSGGDLTARARTSGIAEIDAAVSAQNAMVTRLTAVLEHERHFGADASHQLRNPLAGLRLALETALDDDTADPRESLREALKRADELQLTVEQVLALARLTPQPASVEQYGTIEELTDAARARWHGLLAADGRRIDVQIAETVARFAVPLNAAQQVVDVLVDNARAHGRGTIRITARDALGAMAIEVADEGRITSGETELFRRGVSGRAGTGIGLGLARDLAESHDGRLSLVATDPTTFGLLLPDRRRTVV
ncbi:sensor histidine kinase [Kribbella sp. DT2]|uniref:sensor histidine kinase n=1 Tax=Kribbella sp. DT2 TaxID=3393427 RepID=UPI003CF59697